MAKHQYAMVMDLNKCIGCQTCTLGCKKQWTDGDGMAYMYWNNVETQPGRGYPRQWHSNGGGFNAQRKLKLAPLPPLEDYGVPFEYDYAQRLYGGKNKPVIMSEFGAGAIPGYRRPHHAKWTEQYQGEVLDEQLAVYLNHPQVVGATIWQFCDCRVTNGHFNGRPRTMNNKGTVSEFRLPKAAYEVVKRHMHESRRRWQKQQRRKPRKASG